jgi:DNA-binding response OmpR family regulator
MSAASAAPAADARPLRVLVVDDEPMVREVVTAYLERDGFVVAAVPDGRAALDALATSAPDLVVLDVMLPEVDGFDVLSRLRRQSEVPVILLTARTEEPDRVLGLELGADDYVVKPFSPRELAARVRSVLRRARPGPPSTRVAYGDLVIDGATREVTVGGDPIDLTPKEFDLIAYLAANPRQVFSRGQLLEQVWDSSTDYQDPSTVTVHIRRLRQKIEDDASHPRWLQTVWGVGYKFEP